MVTLKDVQARIAKLQAQAESIVAKQSSAIVEKIHRMMDEYGLTVADLDRSKSTRKSPATKAGSGSGSSAKYQDPKTGATWSGHGRAPAWIANARNRDKFLIDGSPVAVPVKQKTAPKKGNYVRGPQPAMYRDPVSGAEWSGRGRAPAWLASAKDRSRFLIEKASAKRGAATETVAAAGRKKTAAKKAPSKGGAKKAAASKSISAKKPAARKTIANRVSSSNSSGSNVIQASTLDEIGAAGIA